MNKATIFFTLMLALMIFGFGVLIESSLNDFHRVDNRLLTATVQEQYFEIEELKAELAYCNYHLGNEESIVLNALVTAEMVEYSLD